MSDLLLNKVHDEVRAQLSPAEQDDFDKFLNRMAEDTRPSLRPRNTDFVSLGDALAPIRKKAEALAAQGDPDAIKRLERMNRARDRVARGETLPPINPIKCRACGDAGAVYPPLKEGERERRSIPCPECGYAKQREISEKVFPVPDGTAALAAAPIVVFSDGLKRLNALIRALLTHKPNGVLVLIDGMYGTAKTHALAKLYEGFWKQQRTAIYVPSALELERIFTDFEDEMNRTATTDDPEGHAHASARRAARWNRLVSCDYLLIDEMNRYSRNQKGNGWVERHMFTLIDERLSNRKTTIGVGNGLLSDNPNIGLHPGVMDRARSRDSFVLNLDNVESSRAAFGRNGADWHKEMLE